MPSDFDDETPTQTQAYETLRETARKWQNELNRARLQGYETAPEARA